MYAVPKKKPVTAVCPSIARRASHWQYRPRQVLILLTIGASSPPSVPVARLSPLALPSTSCLLCELSDYFLQLLLARGTCHPRLAGMSIVSLLFGAPLVLLDFAFFDFFVFLFLPSKLCTAFIARSTPVFCQAPRALRQAP